MSREVQKMGGCGDAMVSSRARPTSWQQRGVCCTIARNEAEYRSAQLAIFQRDQSQTGATFRVAQSIDYWLQIHYTYAESRRQTNRSVVVGLCSFDAQRT